MHSSPLETVARNHGAVVAERHGRRVPAHFGSTAAEEAVCQHGVGMADRSDRETFELRGTPEAIEAALVELGDRAWASFVAPDRAVVRCEAEGAASCAEILASLDGITSRDRTSVYAAIGLIGPRASELLNEVDLSPSGLIIREGRDSYEILLPAAHGPQLWDYLIEAGEPFELACVGHDALDRLAASRRRPAAG
jgi:glycine cleavage system aminomethyltransferase T